MENFGILLRGKSLEKINLIFNEFDDCVIVNNFKEELNLFEKFIYGKNIIHFVNSMHSASLYKQQYKKFNIDKIIFSFTKKHCNNNNSKKRIYNIISYYKKLKLKYSFIPDELYLNIFNIHNTGVSTIMYISKYFDVKNIWITGLDFYKDDYVIKKSTYKQKNKSNKINLVKSFIDIVNNNKNINYKIVSYYNKFPKLKNLFVIK